MFDALKDGAVVAAADGLGGEEAGAGEGEVGEEGVVDFRFQI